MVIARATRVLRNSALAFLISIVCLSLLFRFTPLTVFGSANLALLFGVYSTFDASAPWYQRLTVAYLVFAGVANFWAGIVGLVDPDGFWFVVNSFLTVPSFALYHLFLRCTVFFPCTVYDIAFPLEAPPIAALDGLRILAAIEVSLSAIAVVAAFFLFKGRNWAHAVWFALVTISILAALVNLTADTLSARSFGPAGHVSPLAFLSLLWSSSYLVAYLIARMPGNGHNQTFAPGLSDRA